MESKSKLALAIGGIVGGSLLAFCCGLILTVMVIVPAREGRDPFARPTGGPATVGTPSVGVGPIARRTPVAPSPAPSRPVMTATPTPRRSDSSPTASATATPSEQPSPPPAPTPTPRFAFFYVQGSRVEELQCAHPYLQGWVRDAGGNPLNGVTIEWRYWNNVEHALSGDRQYLWQDGEFKFTYYGQDPGVETDFVLQVVESADNPVPLSEPLLIRYAGCATMGQITNIVFKQR
jgi:hypothetical protein